jgi:hypothetical protein
MVIFFNLWYSQLTFWFCARRRILEEAGVTQITKWISSTHSNAIYKAELLFQYLYSSESVTLR